MTREEAVVVLNGVIKLRTDAYTRSLVNNGPQDEGEEGYLGALQVAIAALREQEERSKGCEYCTEYKELPEHCLNDGQDVGRIFDTCIQETNQGWHIELPTNFDIGIRFCPMCGRRLEEA